MHCLVNSLDAYLPQRYTYSYTQAVLWGETKKCKCFLALGRSYCGHPGLRAGWAGGELRITETRASPEAEGGRRTRRRKRRRKAAACLLSSQPAKPPPWPGASPPCAHGWAVPGCWAASCWALSQVSTETPGAQPAAFALCRY